MSIKANVTYALQFARKNLEDLIATLERPEDWTAQPCDNANHPLWVIGHLALADNMFAARVHGQEPQKPEGWDELFWFGSEVSGDASKYPNPDEVLAYFRERRENLMKTVEGMDEDALLAPTPDEGMFAEAPNVAAMLMFIAYHEGIHTGQFTVAHRSLGHEPIRKPQPAQG